jgi:cell division protein FtsA
MTIRPLVTLDLGSTKVACAVGLPHEHSPGFELLGTGLVPYPALSDAWGNDPLMVSRTIEQAIDATGVSAEADRALVVLSHPALAGEHVRATVTLGDEPAPVRLQDLHRLQASALDRTLGIDREPLLVERLGCTGNGFTNVRDPSGLSATRLLGTFHIITMPMAARRAAVQVVESAGFEVGRLLYALPAAFAGCADAERSQRRALLIDVGGLTTDVGFFVDGLLHASRIVPAGGLSLAMAIAKTHRVTLDQAVTWSLEGAGCRKPEVRALITQSWDALQEPVHAVLAEEPRPDAVIVTGRGALMDGFAEAIERMTGVPTALGRSGRLSQVADLSRQVGLSAAVGLLELMTRTTDGVAWRSSRLFDRLIDRTRTLLTEYF